MQSRTSTFTAATSASESRPVTTVGVDWARDGFGAVGTIDELSAVVSQVSVSRSITTDLPLSVRRLSGSSTASAEFTVEQSPDGAMSGAEFLSPYTSPAPLGSGVKRLKAPVTISMGYKTSAGSETVPAFTGTVRSVDCDAVTGAAQVHALDSTEKLRGAVSLPFVVADNLGITSSSTVPAKKPGLDGRWVIDYVLRQSGVYATWPNPSGTALRATMHGSAYPEVGTLGTMTLSQASFINAAGFPAGAVKDQTAYTFSPITVGGFTTTVKVEGLFRVDGYGSAYAPYLWTLSTGADWGLYATVSTAGVLAVSYFASGSIETFTGPTVAGWNTSAAAGTAGTVHYVGVTFNRNTTTNVHTVVIRVDGTSTTLTQTEFIAGAPVLTTISAAGIACAYSDLTVSTSPASNWNDAYVATAVLAPSLNTLTATPALPPTPGVDLIASITEAEFGSFGFDEAGIFRWYNRNRLTTEASSTSVQRTLSSASESVTGTLISAATSEAIDAVRNRVTINVIPARVLPRQFVWLLASVESVPASGTLTLFPQFSSPVVDVSTAVVYGPSGGIAQSAYRAAPNQNGSGTEVTNLSFVVTPFLQGAKIVVTNPNAFRVWLVTPAGYPTSQGTPSLNLYGTPVEFGTVTAASSELSAPGADTRSVVDVSDATSITAYDEQPLTVQDSPWRQSIWSMATVANSLLADLKDPRPVLGAIEVVPDPALQLGDRVTVTELTELGINADWHVVGITLTADGSGMSQTLDLRRA